MGARAVTKPLDGLLVLAPDPGGGGVRATVAGPCADILGASAATAPAGAVRRRDGAGDVTALMRQTRPAAARTPTLQARS